MKKLLPVLSLVLLLFSCKKSETVIEEPKAEIKKHDVTFSMADFSQDVVKLSNSNKATTGVGDTLKNYANNLYYRIYNSAGVLVNSVNQTSLSPTFGTVTDKLPSGTYNVFFVASPSAIFTSDASIPFNNAVYYANDPYWNDTFAKQYSLTIGSAALNQSVRLDRVVGGLEVTLSDAIPTGAARISVIYQSESNYMRMNGTDAYYSTALTKNFTLTAADAGQKNRKFLMHVSNTTTTSSVVIRAYDSSNGLIVEKTVPNVRCYKNQKTILTGALFPSTASTNAGFTIVVNPTWGASTNITF